MKSLGGISKRDQFLLLVVIAALAGFMYYTYVVEPGLRNIAQRKNDIVNMQTALALDLAYSARLPAILEERENVIGEIDSIASRYLPDLTTQYYYDLLNKKAHEASLSPTEIKTQMISPAELQPERLSERLDNNLSSAIKEYAEAISDTAPANAKTETESAEAVQTDRHEFKYIPITYSVTDGRFWSIQNFIRSLNDLNYTMYFKSAKLTTNDHLTLDATFEIYFISIDRVFDYGRDGYKYETIPPAKSDDIFFYHFNKEDAIEAGIPIIPDGEWIET